ncbi:hypothetical protein HZA98_03440 [Candidatus Woesearchaeota archaeon]|nr:hypothetical protein [Candidatus Woesearchaeota archaeon]
MAKTITVNQRTLGIVLLLALIAQYINFYSIPLIGRIAVLVVAILLFLK